MEMLVVSRRRPTPFASGSSAYDRDRLLAAGVRRRQEM